MGNCWERAVPLAFHLCCFYFSVVLIVVLVTHGHLNARLPRK